MVEYSEIQIAEMAEVFDVQDVRLVENEMEKVRKVFVSDYPRERILSLSIEEYACGLKIVGRADYRSFCYRIENDLLELGNMRGSYANKFGVYISHNSGEPVFTKKFGTTLDEAFKNIKLSIVSLLDAARDEDLLAIEESRLANLFKYKLIATYYPDRYLPIFNGEHLDEFLTKLGVPFDKGEPFISRQEKLRRYKDNIPCMADWSLFVYMVFLYSGGVGIDSQQKKFYQEMQKLDDEAYPNRFKSGINISEKQWRNMLDAPHIFHDSDIRLLCQIYQQRNHASTCKELSVLNGESPSAYNSPVVHLAKRILAYIKQEPEMRENRRHRYWNVLFWGRELPGGLFEWKLRPQLASALLECYPGLGVDEVNAELDVGLSKDVVMTSFKNIRSVQVNRAKPSPVILKGVQVYPRNRAISLFALDKAAHKCEIDGTHATFTRRIDGMPYTEPHHLIPMAMQDRFDVSLDIPENIVSLCSNCHNEIHYGKHAESLITKLYWQRKSSLESLGIVLSLDELLWFYGLARLEV